ncbi:MAG: YdbL family protein [Alphaproteobacteria bacterium]
MQAGSTFTARSARGLGAVLLALFLGFGLAPAAHAGALGDAKAAGYIGERPDGYLGIADPSAPASVKSMVKEINAKRRAKYDSIAKSQGASRKAVEALAGQKLIQRARRGEYVMDASGRWRRK